MNTPRTGAVAVLCLVLGSPVLAGAPDGDVQRGKEIAQESCARCHSIERSGSSPLALAEPFRELHEQYPVEHLAEALAEGIMTGHPDMPQFQFEPDEIDDLIAFLQSLEKAPGKRSIWMKARAERSRMVLVTGW